MADERRLPERLPEERAVGLGREQGHDAQLEPLAAVPGDSSPRAA